jgi:hypothetical protein
LIACFSILGSVGSRRCRASWKFLVFVEVLVFRGKGCGKRIKRSAWNVSLCSSRSSLYATSPRPCFLESDVLSFSNLTTFPVPHVRRLFSGLSDKASIFHIRRRSSCTQHLCTRNLCTQYLRPSLQTLACPKMTYMFRSQRVAT